jgi:hypothetical protein
MKKALVTFIIVSFTFITYGQACSVDVNYSIVPGTNGVYFEAIPSSVPGENFTAYMWQFGNNSYTSYTPDTVIFHDYLNPGTYTVTLGAYGNGSCITTFDVTVSEPVTGCYAYYMFQPSLTNWNSYNFTGYAGGGTPLYTYLWNVGATGVGASVIIPNSPTEICLTISDGMGCTDTYCGDINANGSPMIPIIYYSEAPTFECDGIIAISSDLLACPGTLICEPEGSVDFSTMMIDGDTVFFNTCVGAAVTSIGVIDSLGGLCSTTTLDPNYAGLIDINDHKLSVFPNPSNGSMTLRIDEGMNEKYDLTIYSLDGVELVKQFNLKDGNEIILPETPGVYILSFNHKFETILMKAFKL